MLTGNVGEWSEVYVLLRLLATGRLDAADENLNKLKEVFFPIFKIIRNESKTSHSEFLIDSESQIVKVYLNDELIQELPSDIFDEQADLLLEKMKIKHKNPTFCIQETEAFMNMLGCFKLAAPSTDKSDITLHIHDVTTGYNPLVGFSIKSELGHPPTLLNASNATTFVFTIGSYAYPSLYDVNEQYDYTKSGKKKLSVRGRLNTITDHGGTLIFHKIASDIFRDNLILIDSRMDEILAHSLLYYYGEGISSVREIVDRLKEDNPLEFGNPYAYEYKFRKFLAAVALGMKPKTVWNGQDEATGGYIIVTKEGDVVAYHLYNRDCFESYLIENTKFDTPSTSRNDFAKVYSDGNGNNLFDLNLQIRFK